MLLLLLGHFSRADSVQPHIWQPTRLPCPWDSPGKNTGVGCHFLLQCMKVKVKNESEVSQLCPTLSDPMDCSSPGSSVHGILEARVLEWGAVAFSKIISIYNYNYIRPFLVAQMVKNMSAMRKTWVWPLSWDYPLEDGMATHTSILALENPHGQRSLAGYSLWGCKELDRTEQLIIYILFILNNPLSMDHSNLQHLLICRFDPTLNNLTPIINMNSIIVHLWYPYIAVTE